jgi:hypothetical protein
VDAPEIVGSTNDAGQGLLAVKAKVPRGDFLRMFQGHARAIGHPLPFGGRTAQMFMAIAAHPVLSDPNHGSSLPNHWRTLYELSHLPVSMLTKALADGRVYPEMARQDVLLLKKARHTADARRPTSQRARVYAQREISSLGRGQWQRYPTERGFLLYDVHALAGRPWVLAGTKGEEDTRIRRRDQPDRRRRRRLRESR